jgi:hypothetical protein
MKIQNCLSWFASVMRNEPVVVWRKPMAMALLCLLFQSTQATQLLQEGFNCASGGTLAGKGAWLNSYSYITVGANPLTYPGLVDTSPSGNEASVLDNPTAGSSTTPFYTYSPFTSVSSGTVYAAFLLDYLSMAGTPNYTFMGLLPASKPGCWRRRG